MSQIEIAIPFWLVQGLIGLVVLALFVGGLASGILAVRAWRRSSAVDEWNFPPGDDCVH
jgi:hypothetical protein